MRPIQALLICLLLLPKHSFATELKIGVFNFKPWGMQVDGKVSGMVLEQASAIFNGTNYSISAVISPYPRMVKRLKSGELDCSIITKNSKNAGSLDFVSHVHDMEVVVISRKGTKAESYEDFLFKGRKAVVGFANGTSHLYPKLYNDPRITAHTVPEMKQGPLMLARQRIDFFVGISSSLRYQLRNAQMLDKVNYPGFFVKSLEVWLQCSKKSSLTQSDYHLFHTQITKLKAQSTFKRIINKWIPPAEAP